MEDQVNSLPLIGPVWHAIDAFYSHRVGQILDGLRITLLTAFSALPLSILLGLLGAWAKLSHNKIANAVGSTYTVMVRGIPELVLIIFVYYGVTQVIQDGLTQMTGEDVRIDLNPFLTGTLTLGTIYGAFMTEVFRGAFQSLDKGQIEAAKAIGMHRLKTFWRIMLPQVWRFALPGIGNVWLVLIKATALMSVVQLDELMRMADVHGRSTREPFLFFLTAAFLYLLITILSIRLQSLAEAWANRGIRRA
jgi:His/Glu/Gln/Arg/opine family amino acid ABC transporter permease subunit